MPVYMLVWIVARGGYIIPLIHALRDKITFVQAQLYNQPAVMATDNKLYSSGNPDYLVAMTDGVA